MNILPRIVSALFICLFISACGNEDPKADCSQPQQAAPHDSMQAMTGVGAEKQHGITGNSSIRKSAANPDSGRAAMPEKTTPAAGKEATHGRNSENAVHTPQSK